MKKVFTAAAVMTVAVMSSSAMAGDWFVGLEGATNTDKVEAQHKESIPGGTLKETRSKDFKGKSIGIRVGKYIDENVRIYASLNKSSWNDADKFNKAVKRAGGSSKYQIKDQQSVMVSGDYVFLKDSPVRPFVGASLGVNRVEALGKKDSSLAYGAQAGVLFSAGPVDLELGMKYTRSNNSIKAKHDGHSLEFTSKGSKQAYLSAAYRF
ncbi:outer membrane beta-barrel protein [Endozoicomonas arenosclerae]|uniref:outer membrane beta-barrel protein n=1 Tax=Endozoicomonas arenosclerae TaxID=1633495 RepID=UPI000781AF0C|nr:outer membrane beta-barrel protein [Endozoicomonas arenosclerae]